MAEINGKVVQVLGGVVDAEFPKGQLPEIYHAVAIQRPGKAQGDQSLDRIASQG